MFYPPKSALFANPMKNDPKNRPRATCMNFFMQIRLNFDGLTAKSLQKPTFFQNFRRILMFFDAFALLPPCFELSNHCKHVFLIRIDPSIIPEYPQKVQKSTPRSRFSAFSTVTRAFLFTFFQTSSIRQFYPI